MKRKIWWLDIKDRNKVPLIRQPASCIVKSVYSMRNLDTLTAQNINWFRYLDNIAPMTEAMWAGIRNLGYITLSRIPLLIEEYYDLDTFTLKEEKL